MLPEKPCCRASRGSMKTFSGSTPFPNSIWPWLFPPACLLHVTEEYLGGGALQAAAGANLKGVNLTAEQFLVVNGAAFLLLILAIILPRLFKFPDWMLVCLGTIILVNAVSHAVGTVATTKYNTGLITGLLIFLPLGLLTLIGLKAKMSTRRYLTAVAVGVAVHGVITLLALRGGHLFRL